jgi:hypothetical protein
MRAQNRKSGLGGLQRMAVCSNYLPYAPVKLKDSLIEPL